MITGHEDGKIYIWGKKTVDAPNKTLLENMESNKYTRIWDCGLIKYVYTNPNYDTIYK